MYYFSNAIVSNIKIPGMNFVTPIKNTKVELKIHFKSGARHQIRHSSLTLSLKSIVNIKNV